MNKKIHLMIKKLSVFLPLLMLLGSCINEDNDDCPTGLVPLRFIYTLNSQYTDLFSEQVTTLNLYLYDESTHACVNTFQLTRDMLDADNRCTLSLKEGKYSLVVWGNSDVNYFMCQNHQQLYDHRLYLITTPNREVPYFPGSLFHGKIDLTVANEKNEEQVVELIKDTNRVKVIVKQAGTRATTPADFSVRINGSNGIYKHENSKADDCSLLLYTPEATHSDTKQEAIFTVLRLFQEDDMRLKIQRTEGSSLIDVSLTDEILKSPKYNTNEDLDRYDNYELEYEFDPNDWSLNLIRVDDWSVVEDPNAGI